MQWILSYNPKIYDLSLEQWPELIAPSRQPPLQPKTPLNNSAPRTRSDLRVSWKDQRCYILGRNSSTKKAVNTRNQQEPVSRKQHKPLPLPSSPGLVQSKTKSSHGTKIQNHVLRTMPCHQSPSSLSFPDALGRKLIDGLSDRETKVDALCHTLVERLYKRQQHLHVVHHDPRTPNPQRLCVFLLPFLLQLGEGAGHRQHGKTRFGKGTIVK